jgi:hypothetical protein
VIHIIWEFRVKPEKARTFEQHYCGSGSWAQFFRKGAGFRDTVLIQDEQDANRYLTIDTWEALHWFDSFKEQFRVEYEKIDKEFEDLTESERRIGVFGDVTS